MTSPATIARKRAGASQLHRVSAGEAMHRGVLSVPFQTPLTKVAEMMARYRMHCVVALDERGEYQTRYWGLIPAAELVRIATTQDLEDRTAGGSMTSQVVTVEPADSVHDAAELMSDHEVDHVIVVDPVSDRPVGVISTLDVAQVLAGERPHTPRGAYRVAQLMKRNVLTVGPSTPLLRSPGSCPTRASRESPSSSRGRCSESSRRRTSSPRNAAPSFTVGPPREVVHPRAEARRHGTPRGPHRRRGDDRSCDHDRVLAHGCRRRRPHARPAVHRLPVLEDGKLVGIVSRADLVSAFSRSDEEIALDIRDDVLLGTFWITPGDVDVSVRHGEVTLRGAVESDLLVELVSEAVQRVPGVVRVKSKLGGRGDRRASGRGSTALSERLRTGSAGGLPHCGGEAARGPSVDRVEGVGGRPKKAARPDARQPLADEVPVQRDPVSGPQTVREGEPVGSAS